MSCSGCESWESRSDAERAFASECRGLSRRLFEQLGAKRDSVSCREGCLLTRQASLQCLQTGQFAMFTCTAIHTWASNHQMGTSRAPWTAATRVEGDRQPSHLFNPIGFLGQNIKRRRSHIPRHCLMQYYGCDDLLNTFFTKAV